MTLKLPHPLREQGLKCGREFFQETVEDISSERVAAKLWVPSPLICLEGSRCSFLRTRLVGVRSGFNGIAQKTLICFLQL